MPHTLLLGMEANEEAGERLGGENMVRQMRPADCISRTPARLPVDKSVWSYFLLTHDLPPSYSEKGSVLTKI